MIAMILAGGSGTRLWPYSRTMSPKQFLNLGSSHESLLQDTCRRLDPIVPPEKIVVIGSATHEFELRQQLEQVIPNLKEHQVLLEPQAESWFREGGHQLRFSPPQPICIQQRSLLTLAEEN